MNTKINIQLAIQGGGAKIVALMAVLEAIEELQDRFTVTHVVGTSAGAIAGTFFASDVGISTIVKSWEDGHLTSLLSQLTIPRHKFIPQKFSVLLHLAKNKPVWKDSKIRDYLNMTLKKNNQTVHSFEDLMQRKGVQVTAISTNLQNRNSQCSSLKDPIIPALMDSAGLPFLLRKWGSGGSPIVVDGGIGNNLPATRLDIKNPDDLAVCISFKPQLASNSNPYDFTAFSMALLDAAIDVSTSQSAALVPNTYFIDTTLNTFDFGKAIEAIKSGEYQRIKKDAVAWFNELYDKTQTLAAQRATAYSVMNLHPWQSENSVAQAVMSGLWKAINQQFIKQPIKFHYVELRATLHCLLPVPQSDILRYTAEFEAGDDPLYCYWLGVSDGVANQLTKAPSLTIQNVKDHEYVPHVRVPALDPQDVHARYEVIFFTPPLLKGNRYRLVQIEEGTNLLTKLANLHKDELGVIPARELGKTPEKRLIVDVPDNIKHYSVKPKPDLKLESLQEIHPHQIASQKDISSISGFSTHAVIGKESVGLFALDITIGS